MSGPFGIPGIHALSTPSCSSRTRWARTDSTVARWFGTTTPMRMGSATSGEVAQRLRLLRRRRRRRRPTTITPRAWQAEHETASTIISSSGSESPSKRKIRSTLTWSRSVGGVTAPQTEHTRPSARSSTGSR